MTVWNVERGEPEWTVAATASSLADTVDEAARRMESHRNEPDWSERDDVRAVVVTRVTTKGAVHA